MMKTLFNYKKLNRKTARVLTGIIIVSTIFESVVCVPKNVYADEYEESTYEEPAYEEPTYEEPAYEEPTYEEPVYEEPSYEEPAYEEPTYKEPTYEEPVYEEPSYEEPTYEEPTYEEPAYEEPTYEESAYEEPTYEEPTYEESAYEEPTYEEPTYEESAYEEPSCEEPSYEEPSYEEPAYEETTYEEPAYEEPTYEEVVESNGKTTEEVNETAKEEITEEVNETAKGKTSANNDKSTTTSTYATKLREKKAPTLMDIASEQEKKDVKEDPVGGTTQLLVKLFEGSKDPKRLSDDEKTYESRKLDAAIVSDAVETLVTPLAVFSGGYSVGKSVVEQIKDKKFSKEKTADAVFSVIPFGRTLKQSLKRTGKAKKIGIK